MAKISTSVALYQAGESLYDLFDKVLLIDEGRCAYFGQAEYAISSSSSKKKGKEIVLTPAKKEMQRNISKIWASNAPLDGPLPIS